MSEETREPASKKTLRVGVRARPGSPRPIRPRRVTLTDEVYEVVWQCEDLAPGATLLIRFRDDPRGPFCLLEFAGNRVVASGNRGPADTSRKYCYEVAFEIGGAVVTVGEGTLLNKATEVVELDPTPGPPPWGKSWLAQTQGT